MKQFEIDLGGNKKIKIPIDVQKDIVRNHLLNSYHWVFGISGIIIGFLLGVISNIK